MGVLQFAADAGPFAFALRATLLLAVAVVIAWALRRDAAGTRHLLWTTTFVALLGLPVGLALLPAWELPILPAAPIEVVGPTLESTRSAEPAMESPAEQAARQDRLGRLARGRSAVLPSKLRATLPSASAMVVSVWLLGTIASLASLLVGVRRFVSLVRTSSVINDPAWERQLDALRARLGIRRRVVLRWSADVPTPMTGGIRRPTVLLPAAAKDWTAERRAVVLAHELVHVRRADALRQVLARLALTVYWFHPLSWVAARLAALSREQACDEEVLALGTRPSDYASHLLDLAATMGPLPAVLTIPMIQRSNLERRLMAILAPRRPRRSALLATGVLVFVAGVGLSAAIARPVPPSPQAPAPKPVAVAKPQAVIAPAAVAVPTASPALAPVAPPALAVPAVRPAPALAPLPPALPQEATCSYGGRSFSGTLSTRDHDGGTRTETSGWSDGDRIIQRYVDDVRLCMRTHGGVVLTDDGNGVQAIGAGGWVLLEAEDAALQRMLISSGPDGIQHEWSIAGSQQPFDADARAWRDSMMEVLNGYWQSSRLRGQQSSLRGKISSARGHVSSLKGKMSSARGHVSSLKGKGSSARGHVSSLKGKMSSARGRVSSLKGTISSHRGKISSLRAAINATSDEQTRERLVVETALHEQQIREVEAVIAAYDLEAEVAEIEGEIANYDLEAREIEIEGEIAHYDLQSRVAEVAAEIERFDLDAKVREIEAEIKELDADRRADEIERAIEPQLQQLRRLIERH